MKVKITLIFIIIHLALSAQSNTEVYVLNIATKRTKTGLLHPKNISNNKGYDNQPSFFDDDRIMFSSTRNGQTDIAIYKISTGTISWKTTTSGSEYSPLKIPKKAAVSAIRLDTDGLQRLYQYQWSNGRSKILLKDLKVGYHVWYNDNILISSVLVDNRMDLVVSHLKNNTHRTIYKNVGRSLHKIPDSALISFISNEDSGNVIRSLDPISGAVKIIKSLPVQIQDMCWLSKYIMLIPDGKTIVQFNYVTNRTDLFHRFTTDEINKISRISISPDGRYLAFVSETSVAATKDK